MASISDNQKCVYPYLGRSGIKVSNICLGTMTFGEATLAAGVPGQSSEELSHKILDRFSEWGGNFIDTANIYGHGNSENIVGSWLEKQPRSKYIIATKGRGNMDKEVNSCGLSRRHLTEAVERSLERLRTDYIDLYQPHGWDDATPVEEVLRTLDDLVRCGKIRYPGFCNTTGWQLQKLVDTSRNLNLNPLVSLQQQYNLACRESELEPFQVCKVEGMAVLPWSPLKGGLFSGKIKKGVKPTEGRLGWTAENEGVRKSQASPGYSSFDDTIFNTLDVAETIAKKHGRSVPQIAIRWLLQKDVTTSVIIGARTLEQLDDNMSAANGWELSKEEMTQLDEASQRPLPYPYEMVFRMNQARQNPYVMDSYVKSKGN